MEEIQKEAEDILRTHFANEGLEISKKEGGREGVDFLLEGKDRNQNELFIQPMDLIKQQSSKVKKEN